MIPLRHLSAPLTPSLSHRSAYSSCVPNLIEHSVCEQRHDYDYRCHDEHKPRLKDEALCPTDLHRVVRVQERNDERYDRTDREHTQERASAPHVGSVRRMS